MPSIPYFALAALLSTSVSSTILSGQAAGCNPNAFSTSGSIPGNDLLTKIESVKSKACTQWAGQDHKTDTFIDAPFKLQFTGTTGSLRIDACVSALDSIIKSCSSEHDFLGGSIISQGIKYSIQETEPKSEFDTKIEAREVKPKGTKTKPKTSKTDPKAPKTDPKKPKTDPKKPKTDPKTSKTDITSNACKRSSKGTKAAAKGKTAKPLTGRAILLDLIQRTVLDKRNRPKTGKICGNTVDFNAGKYPTEDQVRKKSQSAVLIYGFEDCTLTAWSHGSEEAKIESLDVEHILEWQSVTGFFDHMDKKNKGFCNALKKNWVGPSATEIPGVKFESVEYEGTFNDHVARAFPSVDFHMEEFVLLSSRANKPLKQNLFGASQMLSDGAMKPSDPDHALDDIIEGLAVAFYFQDAKIHSLYGIQVKRIEAQLIEMEAEMVKMTDITPNWTSLGLGKEWLTYMDGVWAAAMKKLTDFMVSKPKTMHTKLKCGTAQEDKSNCQRLKAITDTWSNRVDKAKITKRPW